MQPARSWIVGGDAAWTDYRLSATVEAAAVGSVELLVRYTDPDNHDRVELASGAERATALLHSIRGGVTSTTLMRGGGYQVGVAFDLAIDVVGPRVVVTRDGKVMFDGLVPAGQPAGMVGLGTIGDPQASFARLRVSAVTRRLGPWQLVDVGGASGSRWTIEDGALTQVTDLAAAPPAGFAALVGEATLADVRITASAVPGTGGCAGVTLRWSAPTEQYQVLVDSAAATARVVSVTGGVAIELWAGPCAVDPEGWTLVVEAIGERLRVDLDGAELVELFATAHTAGRCGVVSVAGAPTAWTHVEVAVAEPEWETWATVTDVDHHRSGSRLTLRAGSDGLPLPLAPAFPARGVDLRVVAPDGTPGHTSRFLPPARYGAVPGARVVRAVDGTAFVLFVPDGAGRPSLPAGQYRLTLRFRRDNCAVASGSLVLSQRGDTSDEVAVLDIPWTAR